MDILSEALHPKPNTINRSASKLSCGGLSTSTRNPAEQASQKRLANRTASYLFLSVTDIDSSMQYCTECGTEIHETHYYCGQCGTRLTEEDSAPTNTTSGAVGTGFLSGKSMEYLSEAVDTGIDEDQPGHAALNPDMAAALQDFAVIGSIDDIHLLEVLASGVEDEYFNEKETRLMLLGLFRLVRLYDQSFSTEWEAELSDNLNEAMEGAKESLEDESD